MLLTDVVVGHAIHIIYVLYIADAFDMPTSYQQWVWERDAHIYWSMATAGTFSMPTSYQ